MVVTLLLWIAVVDKGSVRVPTVTYVGGRFADMVLGGQSGRILVTVLDDARHLAICPIDRCAQGGGLWKMGENILNQKHDFRFHRAPRACK